MLFVFDWVGLSIIIVSSVLVGISIRNLFGIYIKERKNKHV